MNHRNMWRALVWIGLLAFAGVASAQGAFAVSKQLEASLLVKGEITVDEHGAITGYTLKDPGKLPPGVEAFVRSNLANWAFEPPRVDGNPVRLRNDMSLLLVAKKLDGDSYLMRVQAASFYPQSKDEGYEIASRKLDPPRYPMTAAQSGAQGTVYLIVKVGRDGSVQDVMAEQVNLRVVASENVMRRMRTMFAEASISAARKWQFTPPVRGDDAAEDYWSVHVPVDFTLQQHDTPYGRWIAYIPGPREKASWVEEDLTDASPEAMMAGEPRQLGKEGLRLRTPLSPNG